MDLEKFLYEKFSNIDVNDSFFDSLKEDYEEFLNWFMRKSKQGESAYIQTVNGQIEGFLYLKIETGPITDIEPILKISNAIKIGTFKVNPHGTRLGERFIKKSLDFALNLGISNIYVTMFEKHKSLIDVFSTYGFRIYGRKKTVNGIELVLVKGFDFTYDDVYKNYPLINLNNSKKYLLAIYPEFHTRLFPDSILNNESFDIVKDISHTNSIKKVYICKMKQVSTLKNGDLLVIYRTGDGQGSAEYRSVATSICVVENVKAMREFGTLQAFEDACKNYSVFSNKELNDMFYSNNEYYIIKMTYNIALKKRIIRKSLIEDIGLQRDGYWGFFEISKQQLQKIIALGGINESYIIN